MYVCFAFITAYITWHRLWLSFSYAFYLMWIFLKCEFSHIFLTMNIFNCILRNSTKPVDKNCQWWKRVSNLRCGDLVLSIIIHLKTNQTLLYTVFFSNLFKNIIEWTCRKGLRTSSNILFPSVQVRFQIKCTACLI